MKMKMKDKIEKTKSTVCELNIWVDKFTSNFPGNDK